MTLTPGAILLGLALLVVVLLVVARPFLQRPRENVPSTRDALLAQKESYLEQIASLDFDHETGKVPDNVYEQERQQLLIRAALILRQLETLSNGQQHVVPGGTTAGATAGATTTPEGNATGDSPPEGMEAQIEQAILALRQQRSTSVRPSPTPNGGSHAYCPHCGRPVRAADNFCRSCGHSLRQET